MKRLRRWLRRNRSTRRASRPTVLGCARALCVTALAGVVLSSPAVAYYQESGVNGIASRLSGKKVVVQCADEESMANDFMFSVYGVEGYVEGWEDPLTGRWFPKKTAYVKGEHCDNLVKAFAGDLSGVSLHDFAWSLLTLVHESGHLKGARWAGDEAKTQCWAMQHFKAALNMLGYRTPEQHRLVTWQMIQIHKFELYPEYQLPGCVLPKP